MRSADGRYWMVYNGEIYNYAELAQRLRERGVALRGGSDSEVLLETYAAEGRDALRRLRGMFAFAIWDTKTGELFCARDPFGIKPLYYTLRPRAAGSSGSRPSARRCSARARSRSSTPTRCAGTCRSSTSRARDDDAAGALPAARALPHRPAGRPASTSFRYWRPVLRPAKSPAPETPERILAALRDSVAAHLRSDVPVGAFLSGGVDSAAICAIAAETTAGHADVHGRLRPPRLQRDRAGAGDRGRRSACGTSRT